MNMSSGQLYSEEQIKDLKKLLDKKQLLNFKQVKNVLPEQLIKMKIGRNEKCPCGSGKKFKKCCLTESLTN